MDLKEQLARLDVLRNDRSTWAHNTLRDTYTATLEDVRITVTDNGEEVTWQLVENNELQWKGLSATLKQAMSDACDFTRAYLQSRVNTTHLVN